MVKPNPIYCENVRLKNVIQISIVKHVYIILHICIYVYIHIIILSDASYCSNINCDSIKHHNQIDEPYMIPCNNDEVQ